MSTERYYARKTGITRMYVVVDSTTGRNVASFGTLNAAIRRAAKLNAGKA